jgi:hypothetical protein
MDGGDLAPASQGGCVEGETGGAGAGGNGANRGMADAEVAPGQSDVRPSPALALTQKY